MISDQQIGALITVLRDHESRYRTGLVSPVVGTIGPGRFVADLRLGPIALAQIANCFGLDPAVIAIADEAQFGQLLVTVSRAHRTADIIMTLSSMPDRIMPIDDGSGPIANGYAEAINGGRP